MGSVNPPVQGPAGLVSFREAAEATLSRLRASLAAMLASLPGGCRRAADLERSLRLDRTTGWRLHKVATAPDPLSAGVLVLGPASMRRVLKAANQQSVPAPVIASVRGAYEAFEGLVRQYAGDRATFDSMISAIAGDEAGQIDLALRRDAFRANSHIWGVQAHAVMHTYAVHPSADNPDLLDVASVRGAYDRRLLREGAMSMTVTTRAMHGRDAITPAGGRPEPLGDDLTGLIGAFSHGTLAGSRTTQTSPGASRVEYDVVGIPSSTTMAFGNVIRGFLPWYRTEEDQHLSFGAGVVSPAEVLFLYVLLHRAALGRPEPRTFLLSDVRVPGEPEYSDPRTCPASRHLPVREEAEHVGRGAAALETPDLPRYRELMTWSLGRLGWDPESFEVYRLRIPYPVMATKPLVSFPLPERDAGGTPPTPA